MAEKVNSNLEDWEPRTKLGKEVKSGKIKTISQIIKQGKKILEPEIVDFLLPDLEYINLDISPTQRVTDSGRKISFRAIVIVGDRKGHVGIGSGKSEEVRPALEYAIANAKRNIIEVPMGCGSWECRCNGTHSIPVAVSGKWGATKVTIKPAPKGLGLAANKVVREVLKMAGIKDAWTKALGGGGKYAMAKATLEALNNLTEMKPYKLDVKVEEVKV